MTTNCMSRITHKLFFALAVLIVFTSMDCKDDPPIIPPPPEKKITLTLQDTTCTEAWLQLQFANFTAPHSYTIYRDTTLTFAGMLFANDTVLIDTALLPQRQYSYKALRLESNVAKDSSAVLQIKTMDTTSHEFTFTIDTIGGQKGFSILRDVAIIDGNTIWAVGQMNLDEKDSTGTPILYNLAQWNGTTWNLSNIPMKVLSGNVYYNHDITNIIAFSQNDIYATDGGSIAHYTGTWSELNLLYSDFNDTTFGRLNRFWGASGDNFWAVAGKGNIYHFNKTSWTRTRVTPEIDLSDITGTSDGKIAIASGYNTDLRMGLFRFINGYWETAYTDISNPLKILNDTISDAPYSVINIQDKYFFTITFNGLYRCYYNTKGEAKRLWKAGDPYRRYVRKARGSKNDLIMIGADGIVHYNGYTWKNFDQFKFQNSGFIFESLDYKNNLGVAAGWLYSPTNNKAIIVRITHN